MGQDLGRYLKDEIEVEIFFPKVRGVKHVTDSKKTASVCQAAEGEVDRFIRLAEKLGTLSLGYFNKRNPGEVKFTMSKEPRSKLRGIRKAKSTGLDGAALHAAA